MCQIIQLRISWKLKKTENFCFFSLVFQLTFLTSGRHLYLLNQLQRSINLKMILDCHLWRNYNWFSFSTKRHRVLNLKKRKANFHTTFAFTAANE